VPKPPTQSSFDFPDEAQPRPVMEAPRPVRIPRQQGTSVCRYCGSRVPNRFMERTPLRDETETWKDARGAPCADPRKQRAKTAAWNNKLLQKFGLQH
jgi:hypothetical protein